MREPNNNNKRKCVWQSCWRKKFYEIHEYNKVNGGIRIFSCSLPICYVVKILKSVFYLIPLLAYAHTHALLMQQINCVRCVMAQIWCKSTISVLKTVAVTAYKNAFLNVTQFSIYLESVSLLNNPEERKNRLFNSSFNILCAWSVKQKSRTYFVRTKNKSLQTDPLNTWYVYLGLN